MKRNLIKSMLLTILLTMMTTTAVAQSHWSQFRGPGSRGVADGSQIPDRWTATENVAWKRDIPGRGWSSPVVWNDRIFLTTVINMGKTEEAKKGLYFGGNRPEPPDSIHRWMVVCLDLKTGETRWERQVHDGKPESAIHLKSSFASETPITDGERLYCCFGSVGIFCFDLDGNGHIDGNEMHQLLLFMGLSVTEEEVRRIIHEVDRDADGEIVESEFLVIMKQAQAGQLTIEAPTRQNIRRASIRLQQRPNIRPSVIALAKENIGSASPE